MYSYANPAVWQISPGLAASIERLLGSFEVFRQKNALLDVGCGAGHLLRAAAAAKWRGVGLEVSPAAAARLRDEGLDVHHGDLLGAPLEEGTFDVVTLVEVIEHLPDPAGYLDRCLRLLRPGGLLFLTTPNFGSLSRRVLGARWRAIEVPEHLVYFSERPMRLALRRAGFRNIRIRTEGANPVEVAHCLRSGKHAESLSRARETSTALLDAAASNALARGVKGAINAALALTGVGDTLKVRALR